MSLPMIPLHIPSKPEADLIRGGQAKRRYNDTFFDQHKHPKFPNGRPWCGPREMAAMSDAIPRHPDPFLGGDLQQGESFSNDEGKTTPVEAALCFASVWDAPWVPLKRYFRFNYTKKLIRLDYPGMMVDEKRGLDDYYKAAAKLGVGMNIRVRPNETPDWQITQVMGAPSQMYFIAQAAQANDAWLLGLIDEPNPKLAAILGLSEHGLPLPAYESPEPVMSAAQIIATPQPDLMAVIAALQEQVAALTAKKAKRVADGKAGAAKRHATPAVV